MELHVTKVETNGDYPVIVRLGHELFFHTCHGNDVVYFMHKENKETICFSIILHLLQGEVDTVSTFSEILGAAIYLKHFVVLFNSKEVIKVTNVIVLHEVNFQDIKKQDGIEDSVHDYLVVPVDIDISHSLQVQRQIQNGIFELMLV